MADLETSHLAIISLLILAQFYPASAAGRRVWCGGFRLATAGPTSQNESSTGNGPNETVVAPLDMPDLVRV